MSTVLFEAVDTGHGWMEAERRALLAELRGEGIAVEVKER